MKDNNTGPACKKCNDTGYIVIRSHNGRYARPGPVPDCADRWSWFRAGRLPPKLFAQILHGIDVVLGR